MKSTNNHTFSVSSTASLSFTFFSYISLCLFVLLAVSGISAQSINTSASIASMVNPDGSINTTASGAINDLSNYRLTAGPKGEPRLLPSSKPEGGCPDGWDTSFTTNGANDEINVIYSDGAGNIYFGGQFTLIGGIAANRIAKWNSTTNIWSALGEGVSFDEVNTIVTLGTDVYIGGNFSHVNGSTTPARNVAKWNGTTWSALGAGLGGGTHRVYSSIVDNGEVIFGGEFFIQAGSPSTGMARWNGTTWTNAGTVNPTARSIVKKDGQFYVGSGSGVLVGDGTTWTQLGNLTGVVAGIAFKGNELWAVGSLRVPGDNNIHVARWNGTTWGNFTYFGSVAAYSIAVDGNDVYVGVSITRSGGQSFTDGVVKHNGGSWVALGTGTQGGAHAVKAILVDGTKIYMGGDFLRAGGLGAQNLAILNNGSVWSSFPATGVGSAVSAIATYGNDVYVGGTFISAGPITANRIAKWNSTTNTWSTLGEGFYSQFSETESINAIAVGHGNVYAGGQFARAGGPTGPQASNIAYWNGASWVAMGSGVNGRVNAILIKGNDVYVAGSFTTAGGIAVNNIAKWNGTSWSSLGTNPIPSQVLGLASIGNDIYVNSTFTSIDNPNYLLKYNGTAWTALANGMTGGGPDSMGVIGNNVYVAGNFNSVGGVPGTSRIARWDGTAWNAVPNDLPINSNPRIITAGADLIVSADFTSISGVTASNIARWDGSSWHAMGNGIAGGRALKGLGASGNIYVTGTFLTAGCNTSPYFARYRRTVWTGATSADWHTTSNWGDGAVPPVEAGVTISAANASITSSNVTVSSLTVENSRSLTIGTGRTLTVTGNLNIIGGVITGPGTLIVNGEIMMNDGGISNLTSVTVDGAFFASNGTITDVGSILAKSDLTYAGSISVTNAITVNRNFTMNGNTSGGVITVLNDMNITGGSISNASSLAVTRHLSLNGGGISQAGSVNVGGNLAMNTGHITGPGTVTMTACAANSLTGGSPTSYINSPLTRCVSGSGSFRFPVAVDSTFSYAELNNVTGSGNVTMQARSGEHPNATGLSPNRLQRWWSTSATGITKADLDLMYYDADVVGNENYYRGFSISGGTATRIPTTSQTTINRSKLIGVTNFAAFTLAEAGSVNALMNGRLFADNRGADHVEITMTDEFGTIYKTKTNQMGFFRFDTPLPTIRQYTFAFKSKRYQLATRAVWFDGDPRFVIVGP